MGRSTRRRTRLLCSEPLEGRWLLSALARPAGLDADEPDEEEDADAVLVETHQLPAPVVASLESHFPGARFLEAEAVADDGRRLYEVTAEFRGREIDITFGGDGNVIETDGLPEPEAPAEPELPASPADPVQLLELEPAGDDAGESEVEVPTSRLPAEIAAQLSVGFPAAEVTEAELDLEGATPQWEVTVLFNGAPIEITFATDGAVVETERPLATADVPPEVLDWVRRNYPGARIEDAAVVNGGGEVSYDLVIAPPGGEALEATVRLADAVPRQPEGDEIVLPDPPRESPASPDWLAGLVPNANAELTTAFSIHPQPQHQGQSQALAASTSRRQERPAEEADATAEEAAVALGGPATIVARLADAVLTGASRAAWVPQLAAVISQVLRVDVATIERRLKDILAEVESAAANLARGRAAESGLVRISLAAALVAVAQVLQYDARRRRTGRAVVFNAATSDWAWVLGSSSCASGRSRRNSRSR